MSKRMFFFTIFNLMVISGSLAAGVYAYVAANRYFSQNVIFIAPQRNESHLHWSSDSIDLLERQFTDYTFSVESRGNVVMSSSTHQVSTTVIFTDASYFNIHFMEFAEGNRWREDANAVVINEALAWRLFGGENIVGLYVEINNRPYAVTGVVRQERNAQGDYIAWMPYSTLTAQLPITAIFLQAYRYNIVDAAVVPIQMLQSQFRNPRDYTIVDINRYIEAMGIRYRILVYILLAFAAILFTAIAAGYVKAAIEEKTNFRKVSLYAGFYAVIAVLCLCVFFIGSNSILYWLPNLANPDISAIGSITNRGALPPDAYLSFGLQRLSYLNRLGNIVWVAGVIGIAGLVMGPVIFRPPSPYS